MGSTGSDSFTDYSGRKKSDSTNGGSSGGASGIDPCQQAFSCVLEEVPQCDWFAQTQTVPPPGTALEIILRGRLLAVDANGSTIGALPTSCNYLAGCLEDGVRYIGVVTSSSLTPIPTVAADFNPQ